MQRTLRKSSVAAALLCLTLFVGIAARAADDPQRAPRSSYLRVVHAIPGAAKIDLYLNNKKTLNDITFGAQTKYLRLPAGDHRISLLTNEPSRTLFSSTRRLRLDRFYTLIAYGKKAAPRFRVLDETVGAVHPRRARFMVTHLSPGAPPIDVVGRTRDGRWLRLASRVRYGQTRHMLVPPGPYTLYVRAGAGNVLTDITSVDLQAGRRYSAFAIGQPRAKGENAFRVMLDPAASQ
ncbi:MAG TPA: DUF4397 domain-containing protein [Abditibacteriaceae bacterium]